MSRPLKGISLYDEQQLETFENAEAAARDELGEDATLGEVVRELSRAYTGWDAGGRDE